MQNLTTDLLLIHCPSIFEFRNRRDIYFPYWSTTGDVPITPLYEQFPLGFKTLQSYLARHGFDARIVNLSSVLLTFPRLDVRKLLGCFHANLVGIDLHWMVHVQGALEIARLVKSVHPEVPVLFGGFSATYYAEELISYPQVDMVLKGYDTHEPARILLQTLRGDRRLERVPNLLWKDKEKSIHSNRTTHKPQTLCSYVDWSSLKVPAKTDSFPILEILSSQSTGCAFNCNWCGGSRDAFCRMMGVSGPVVLKDIHETELEMETLSRVQNIDRFHLYSAGNYNEGRDRFLHFLDLVRQVGFRSVSYEFFHLPDDSLVEAMVHANPRASISLSPQSHDLRIASLAGRCAYTMDQLEAWIERTTDRGLMGITIWFCVGMQEQTVESVRQTLGYCEKLLKRFRGKPVIPVICPMLPVLDPGSTFFENPEAFGYTLFFRSLEDHRVGMQRASLINRMNYETRWMSRKTIVETGYEAIRRLVEMKGASGLLPSAVARDVASKLDDTVRFLRVIHEIDCIEGQEERAQELERIGDEIVQRNQEVLFSGVQSQISPVYREIGYRWFDEIPADLCYALTSSFLHGTRQVPPGAGQKTRN